MMAGVDLIHVPYRSEALALPDLLGGQVQVLFRRDARFARLAFGPKQIACTGCDNLAEAPGAFARKSRPWLNSCRVSEANGWYGIVVPKATPTEIVDTLNKTINAALADPTMKQRFVDLGMRGVRGYRLADFEKFIVDENRRSGRG